MIQPGNNNSVGLAGVHTFFMIHTGIKGMAIRLWSFQTGGTKLERFLHKNQHTQKKLLNLENWINGGFRSFQKSGF